MAYTTALTQWAGPQCLHTSGRPARTSPQAFSRKGLYHPQHSICRLAQLKQRLPHATGTQVRDEDLQSVGNQEAFQELHEEKVLDAVTDDSVIADVIQEDNERKPAKTYDISDRFHNTEGITDDDIVQCFEMYGPKLDDNGRVIRDDEDETDELAGIDREVDTMLRFQQEIYEDLEEDEDDEDEEKAQTPDEIFDSMFEDQAEALGINKLQKPEFTLNFLWLEKNLGVSVDQVFGEEKKSPVTEYFFWPRADAWEELKNALEDKQWIHQDDKIYLLNGATLVINFWQDSEVKPSLDEVRERFPDCMFQGSS